MKTHTLKFKGNHGRPEKIAEIRDLNEAGQPKSDQDILDEAFLLIHAFCAERNFKIYYTRTWNHNGVTIFDGYTGFIFQNRYGDPLSPHSVNRAIDRICAAYIEDETVLADQEGRDPVLIRHFSAHNLRHTFCTRFCENERNIKVIQEIMGHADIETTMNIYAEATKEKKKESFSNLEGKIKIS